MPIVHLRGSASKASLATRASLGFVATETAAAAGCGVEQVWCTFQGLEAMTLGTRSPAEDESILFVDLLLQSRGGETTAQAVQAVARAAAESFQTKLEDVWARAIVLDPSTVFAGGELR